MAVTSVKTGSSFTSLIKYDSLLAGNSAYSPSLFYSIATVSPTSGATATFTSIPATYSSLHVRVYAGVSVTGSSFSMTFNSDTAANYAWHVMSQDTSSLYSGASANDSLIRLFGTSKVVALGYPMGGTIDVVDYASTSKYKTVRATMSAPSNTAVGLENYTGHWRSTTAVTSLTITSSQAFASGTSIALYGIQ